MVYDRHIFEGKEDEMRGEVEVDRDRNYLILRNLSLR
jgi:hypothetical protein